MVPILVKPHSGFTITELLVIVAIVSLLVALAVPSFGTFFDKRRLIVAAEAIYSEIQLARSESIARSRDIFMEFDTNGSTSWKVGTSETQNCDPDDAITDVNPCYLVIESGVTTGTQQAEDWVLRVLSSIDYTGVSMIHDTAADCDIRTDDLAFDYVRGTATVDGDICLQSENGRQLRINVSLLGRVSVCSPTGAAYVSGYNSNGCTGW